MSNRFSFSLNGSDWRGEFASRKEARIAAFDAARELPELPGVVYVGKVVGADPQVSGHAQSLIAQINARADAAGLGEYLGALNVEQVRELDNQIAKMLLEWLNNHKLLPAQFHVEGISEYPVPVPPAVKSGPVDEVNDLGPNNGEPQGF